MTTKEASKKVRRNPGIFECLAVIAGQPIIWLYIDIFYSEEKPLWLKVLVFPLCVLVLPLVPVTLLFTILDGVFYKPDAKELKARLKEYDPPIFNVDVPIAEQEMDELVKMSLYVQGLCIDNKEDPVYGHHLPIKDPKEHFVTPENWDLGEDQIKQVKQALDTLSDYAEKVYTAISLYYENRRDYQGVTFSQWILPPWLVFPHYPVGTIGWRMGSGETYKIIWSCFWNSISSKEKLKYLEEYPEPEYWNLYGQRTTLAGLTHSDTPER